MSERITEQLAGINPKCIGCRVVGLCAEILQAEREDLAAGVEYTMDAITESGLDAILADKDELDLLTDNLVEASARRTESHSRLIEINEKEAAEFTKDCPGLSRPSFWGRLIGVKPKCGLSLEGQSLMMPVSSITLADPRVREIKQRAMLHIRDIRGR